jgi:hypothetical protein
MVIAATRKFKTAVAFSFCPVVVGIASISVAGLEYHGFLPTP